jgi:hypothetical protein
VRFRLLAHAALIATCLALAVPCAAEAVTVSTLAGSGAIGTTDGPGASATFMMPAALAWDLQGRLLVLDAAAQRVRRVSSDGIVETVAGSGDAKAGAPFVVGGFRDGDALHAKFNWPRGIAVGKDGVIYVADTGNHCIRAISRAGQVAVFAGSPTVAGSALGARLQARFIQPMGLAIDPGGNLLVADPEVGLRKIDSSGNVSAMPYGTKPFGVSVGDAGGYVTMYIAEADQILEVFQDKVLWRLTSINHASPVSAAQGTGPDRMIAMEAPVGYPLAVTQIADHLFFGDVRTNAIRYVYPTQMLAKIVAGGSTEDSSGEGAGYQDGDGATARFNGPVAVAARPDGTLAVADAGNRRIRLARVDLATEIAHDSAVVPVQALSEKDYSIVLVGNSFTWYDSVGGDSLSGLLERQLVADRALEALQLQPRVRFVGFGGWDALNSTVASLVDIGTDKLLIVQINSSYIEGESSPAAIVQHPDVWGPKLVGRLRALRQALGPGRMRLVVMLHPAVTEISPNEVFSVRLGLGGMVPDSGIHDVLRGAVAEAGVDFVDTYPDFRANALRPTAPLSLGDGHMNVHGRDILMRAFARGLEAIKPWAQPGR